MPSHDAICKQPSRECTYYFRLSIAEQINEFLEWLEQSWYTDSEMQKSISEDELLEFIESIAESAKQQAD